MVWLVVGPVLLIAAALFIVTRPAVLTPLLESVLSEKIGGTVWIGSARVAGFSAIVLDDVVIRSNALAHPAGEIASIEELKVTTSLPGLLIGRTGDTKITLNRPRFRLAEDRNNPGRFTFMTLGPDEMTDDPAGDRQLIVNIFDGLVEMGGHAGGEYEALGTMAVAGTVYNTAGSPEWFNFALLETDALGNPLGEAGVRVEGRINSRTFEYGGRVDGLAFDDRYKSLCPQMVRLWWERLELDGRFKGARIRSEGVGDLWAEIDVEDVGLTIPLDNENIWSRFAGGELLQSTGMPRMQVESGKITLSGRTIHLANLTGELASSAPSEGLTGVPYRVDGTIGPVPEFEWQDRAVWMDYVLEAAPVALSFELTGFELETEAEGPMSAVEIPTVVADILSRFSLKSCILDANIDLRRDAPSGEPGRWIADELKTAGRARLRNGHGAYTKFPYPLADVSAEITFNSEAVRIESLIGRGPAGGTVSIGGAITPPSAWPRVTLHISGKDIPLDETLRNAMNESFQHVLDSLMDESSLAHLREAGVLPDSNSIPEFEATVTRLLEEREQLRGRASVAADLEPHREEIGFLDRRIASLRRMIDSPEFELGGTVDFELDVVRDEGSDSETYTTGSVAVRRVGLMYDRFPYPITVHDGWIEVLRDGVVIHDLVGTAVGGGQAVVSGRIHTQHNEAGMQITPDLEIGLIDDVLNPCLIETIPLAGGGPDGAETNVHESLDATARLLRAFGIGGLVSYHGTVVAGSRDEPDWNFAVRLSDGAVEPDQALSHALRAEGLPWPPGLALRDLAGEFSVTPRGIRIARLQGTRGEGRVSATGLIEAENDRLITSLNMDFEDFPIDDYLLTLLPEAGLNKVRELWERYRPHGSFDASLRYHGDGSAEKPLEFAVRVKALEMDVAGSQIEALGAESFTPIVLGDQGFAFSDLILSIQSAGRSLGVVSLSMTGDIVEGGAPLRLVGRMKRGRFDSPVIRELLRTAEGDVPQWYKDMNPRGLFNAEFSVSVDEGEPAAGEVSRSGSPNYEVTLAPDELVCSFNEREIHAAGGSGSVRLTPGKVEIQGLAGRFPSGAAWALTGEVSTGDAVAGEVNFSYRNTQIDDDFRALLPPAVAGALEAIRLGVDGSIEITNAKIGFEQMVSEGGETTWRRSFVAPVDVRGVSFEAGLPFSEVNGHVVVSAETRGEDDAAFKLDISAESAVADRWKLHDVDAVVVLSQDGKHLIVPHVRASLYEGVVTATATSQIDDPGRYAIQIDAVDVNFRKLADASKESSGEEVSAAPTGEKGTIYGSLSIEGYRDRPETRRGRGSLRLMHGTLASNPITVPLMQLSQLMIPLDASLEYGEMALFIRGDVVGLERVVIEGDRLMLVGDGMMGIDDLQLDVRLRSRGTVRGLSDLIGGFNDQFYAIHLSGPLHNPQASIIPLPGLGGFFRDDWFDRNREAAAPATATVIDSEEK